MRRLILTIAAATALAGSLVRLKPDTTFARAQERELPAFEVASVKPRTGEPALPPPPSPDRFTYPDATLATLISFAFDVQDFQVLGGADWIRSTPPAPD